MHSETSAREVAPLLHKQQEIQRTFICLRANSSRPPLAVISTGVIGADELGLVRRRKAMENTRSSILSFLLAVAAQNSSEHRSAPF
jgi:hypothetical protein